MLDVACPTCGHYFEVQDDAITTNVRCSDCGLLLRVQDNLAPKKNPLGLWRDAESLVIRVDDAAFPSRCVKTNEPIDGPSTHLDVVWVPHHGIWLLMLGALGHLIAKSLYGQTISLDLPLSPAWLFRHRLKSRIGWSILLGGIGCFVIGTVFCFIAAASRMGEVSSERIFYVTLSGPFIAVAGMVSLCIFDKPIATVRRVTPDHLWIGRMGTAFLESLPEWPR